MGDSIKVAEARLTEIAVLKTHIINYAKTREVYTAYRKTGYSKAFLEAHRERTLCTRRQKLPLTKPDCKSCRRSRCWMRSSQRKRTPPKKLRPDKRIPPRTLPVLGRCPRCFFVCIAKIYDWIFVKQHPQTAYRKYAVLIGTIFENCDNKKGILHMENGGYQF